MSGRNMWDVLLRLQYISINLCASVGFSHNIEHACTYTCSARLKSGAVESESESEGILGGVGVGKSVPTPTPTSI
jgi:hypothetical protein